MSTLKRREACALLGSLATAGCLGTGRSGPSGEVTVLWSDGAPRADAVREALSAAGLPAGVDVTVYGGGLVDTLGLFEETVEDGEQTPEIAVVGANLRGEGLRLTAARHGLPDLRSVVDSDLGSKTFRMGRSAMRRDDALVGLPLFVVPTVVCYRRDWLADAGVETSDWATDPPTWNTFASAIRSARDGRSVDGFLFKTRSGNLPHGLFYDLLSAAGSAYFGDPSQYLFGPVGDRPVTIDERSAIDAASILASFVSDGSEGVAGLGPSDTIAGETAFDRLVAGDAVASRITAYRLGELDAESRDRIGVMPAPVFEGVSGAYPWTGGPASTYYGQYAGLNPNVTGDRREAAAAVFRAMATDTFVERLYDTVADEDGQRFWFPARPSVYESSTVTDAPLGDYAPAVRTAAECGLTQPVTDVWFEEYTVIDDTLETVLTGQTEPEPAMTELASRLRDLEGAR